MNSMNLSDATLMRIADDIVRSLTRPKYEELLVKLEFYSLGSFHYDDGYTHLSKKDLIIRTLEENGSALVDVLHDTIEFSTETKRALAMDGIEFGHSLAGDLASPAEERSHLEISLATQALSQVSTYLEQSLEDYSRGNYEAANAMTRTALEHLVEETAKRIGALRGNEAIPKTRRHIGPVDYRNYLEATHFLDGSEKRYLDAFYGYSSTNGSHPGISSEAEARLRRFVAVAIALLFLEKLENNAFMQSLV